MADETVLIAVQAIDNATAALNKVASSLSSLDTNVQTVEKSMAEADSSSSDFTRAVENTGKAAEESSGRFSKFGLTLTDIASGINLAQGALDTVVGTFEKVWASAKEGATIERIGTQFKNMSDQAGVSSDALLAALDKAAHGTVDDEELMQTATRALALGITKNTGDLVKLMDVARASAVAFGGSTSANFERISQAVENLTPRALKQMGIIVDLKSAYEEYARAQGEIPAQLSDEEKRQALLNQVLEKSAGLIKKVGDQGEDTATKMERFETRTKNLGDRLHEVTANAFGPILDAGADYETMTNQSAAASDRLAAAQRILASGFSSSNSALARELLPSLTDLANKQETAAATSDDVDAAARRAAAGQAEAEHAARDLAIAEQAVEQGAKNQAAAFGVMDSAMDTTTAKAALLASSQKMIAQDMTNLKTAMAGAIGKEFYTFNTKQDDLRKKAADIVTELNKLQGTQGDVAKTTLKHAMSTNELALAQARLAEMTARYNKETDPAKQAALAAQIGIQRDRINEANTAVVSYVDNSKRIGELKNQYADVNKSIEENARAHEEATRRILFGYAEQQLSIGGLTETEINALDKLAVQWGLKSQADVDAMAAIRDAAQKLSQDNNVNLFAFRVDQAADKTSKALDKSTAPAVNAGKNLDTAALKALGLMNTAGKLNSSLDNTTKATGGVTTAMANATRPIDYVALKALGINTEMANMPANMNNATSSIDLVSQSFLNLATAMGSVPASVTISTTTTPGTSPGTLPSPEPRGGAGYARGGSFIVPSGYPNDSYPANFSSGERVTVQSPGQKAAGFGAPVLNLTINAPAGNPENIAASVKNAVYDAFVDIYAAAGR